MGNMHKNALLLRQALLDGDVNTIEQLLYYAGRYYKYGWQRKIWRAEIRTALYGINCVESSTYIDKKITLKSILKESIIREIER